MFCFDSSRQTIALERLFMLLAVTVDQSSNDGKHDENMTFLLVSSINVRKVAVSSSSLDLWATYLMCYIMINCFHRAFHFYRYISFSTSVKRKESLIGTEIKHDSSICFSVNSQLNDDSDGLR